MARPRTVEISDVISAAKQLLADGKSVTKTGLRERLGRGRPEVLFEMYTEYVREHGDLIAPLPVTEAAPVQERPELPTEVAEQLSLATGALMEQLEMMVYGLNQSAYSLHNKRVNAEVLDARRKKELADLAVEESTVALEKAYDEIEEKQDEIDRLEDSLSAAKGEISALNAKLSEMTTQLEALTNKLDDSESRRMHIEQEQAKLEAQHEQQTATLVRLTAEKEAQGEALTQCRSQLTESETHRNESEQKITKLEAQHEQQTATLDRIAAEKEVQSEALAKCQASLKTVEDEYHQLQVLDAGHVENITGLRRLVSDKEAALSALENQVAALQQSLKDKETQLAVANSKMEDYRELKQQAENLQQRLIELANNQGRMAKKE